MKQATAATWWLTGLPDAGKITLAHAMAHALRKHGEAACVIDGDELRAGLCNDLGYDDVSRAESLRRAGHLAQMLNANAIHAIVAIVSPAASARQSACFPHALERCKDFEARTPLAACNERGAKPLSGCAAVDQSIDTPSLTSRQQEVLSHLCTGKPNKAIARELGLSENTVRVHLAAIFAQLRVNSRSAALLAAQRLGLSTLQRQGDTPTPRGARPEATLEISHR